MSFKDTFRGDSAYSQIMTKIFDIFWLSLMWLFTSLPVITIGVSTTALYSVMLKLVRDEESAVTRTFFKAFKENFRQAFPAGILMLLIEGILAADFHILKNSKAGNASVVYGCCIVIFLVTAAVFSYVYPLIGRYENTLKKIFENGARLAASHLWQTVIMVAVNVFPMVWFMVSPETFSVIFWIWVFIGGGLQAFINSLFISKIFYKLEEKESVTAE